MCQHYWSKSCHVPHSLAQTKSTQMSDVCLTVHRPISQPHFVHYNTTGHTRTHTWFYANGSTAHFLWSYSTFTAVWYLKVKSQCCRCSLCQAWFSSWHPTSSIKALKNDGVVCFLALWRGFIQASPSNFGNSPPFPKNYSRASLAGTMSTKFRCRISTTALRRFD